MAYEPKKSKPRLNVALGDSGTEMFHGYIAEEYNTDLADLQGIKIYDEMRRSDGTVRATIQAITLPVRRAHWYIEPAGDDNESKQVAEFVEHALFDWQTITWDDFLRHALLMLPFGVMVFEKVFALNEEGKIVWHKLAPRLPKSIQRWEMANGQPGIQQRTSDGKLVDIPREKLCIFVNEMEGDNWWGTSILRAPYKHWFMKNQFYKIDAIAFERQGLGVPRVKYPQGSTDKEIKDAEESLKRLRAHEEAYISIPEGWEVDFMEMGAKSTRDPATSIAHHNREIAKSVLAQFLELGATETGSRALSEDHSRLFMLSLEAVANTIKDVFNKYAIPQLINLNFSVKEYPTLEYADIRDIDAEKLANAYNTLTLAGGLKATESDERYFRELMDLPELTDEDLKKREEEQKKQEKLEQEAAKNAAKPIPDRKKASELDFEKKKIAAEFKPFRKLTFAEDKVDFNRINNELNRLEEGFNADARRILSQSRDRYLNKLREVVKKKDNVAIKALQLQFGTEYARTLKELMKESFVYGKNGAAKEMNVQAPANPQQMLSIIDAEADAIAKHHAQELTRKSKQGLLEGLKKQAALNVLVGELHEQMTRQIEKLTGDTSGIVTGGYMNHGRGVVFDAYDDRIYALQRSEILDTKVCNYCLSIDGRIIEKDDSFGLNTIFHSSCRGLWSEILVEEEEKPPISGIPQSLRDRFGDAVNALIQPRKPIVKKDSLANKFIKKKKPEAE
jgi:hypothetical protein